MGSKLAVQDICGDLFYDGQWLGVVITMVIGLPVMLVFLRLSGNISFAKGGRSLPLERITEW